MRKRYSKRRAFVKRVRRFIRSHSKGNSKRAEEFRRRDDERLEYAELRSRNRLKMIEEHIRNASKLTRIRYIVGCGIVLIVIAFALELFLEDTMLRRSGLIENTPLEKIVEALPSKEYKDYGDVTEDEILWKKLMKHFDNNKTATLGVMCNLNSESRFKANNLEDYNNELWEMDDEEYTKKVNDKIIDKQDFLESRNLEYTNGYYNQYNEWVNVDGGYGYGQYTAYGKKEGLYQYAEQWFGPDGKGEKYKFNIADPEMQASYIVHLLESDEYKSMDKEIRNAKTVVDACYIWLKKYEIPYDPYNDGYYTLAFDRAYAKDAIEASCDATPKKSDKNGDTDNE